MASNTRDHFERLGERFAFISLPFRVSAFTIEVTISHNHLFYGLHLRTIAVQILEKYVAFLCENYGANLFVNRRFHKNREYLGARSR